MRTTLITVLAIGLLVMFAVPALAMPAPAPGSRVVAVAQPTHRPTNAELCSASGCIMTGTDKSGRPVFVGNGCERCYEDTPTLTPQQPALPAKRNQSYAQTVHERAATTATRPTNLELCGSSGCIMRGTDKNGRAIFEGYGCDHCYDDVAPAVALDPAIIRTIYSVSTLTVTVTTQVFASGIPTVTTVLYQTDTVFKDSPPCVAETVTNTLTAIPNVIATTTATETATVMAQQIGTATQYAEFPVPDACHRIGTMDQGGPTWIGTDCKGDSVYHGEDGCSRVGTLDNGGAIWVGRGCLNG